MVYDTSFKSPLRYKQKKVDGVESIRKYTGPTYRMAEVALRYQHSAYQFDIVSTTHKWSGNLVSRDIEQAWNVE